MQNTSHWRPSKFIPAGRGWRASRDAAIVSRGSRLIVDILARRYHALLQEHARGSLLDLGCGTAPLFGMYKDLATSVTCVDWENSFHDQRYLDMTADLCQPLPLPESAFDTVLLTDVLEHVPEPQRLFCNIHRLLRPGGKLILGVPFLYWLHEQPHDYFRYSEFALRYLCQAEGLEVLHLEAYGGLPEVLLDLAGKAANALPRWISIPLVYVPVGLGGLCLQLSPLRRLSARSAAYFPLGYCLVALKTGGSKE